MNEKYCCGFQAFYLCGLLLFAFDPIFSISSDSIHGCEKKVLSYCFCGQLLQSLRQWVFWQGALRNWNFWLADFEPFMAPFHCYRWELLETEKQAQMCKGLNNLRANALGKQKVLLKNIYIQLRHGSWWTGKGSILCQRKDGAHIQFHWLIFSTIFWPNQWQCRNTV